MKTVRIPYNGAKCFNCKDMVYAVETPSGGDYYTCPICRAGCECCFSHYKTAKDLQEKRDIIYSDDYDGDEYHYCKYCRIIFDIYCTHAVNGCTDDVYFAQLVKSYTYEGKTYEGMIEFDSYRECLEKIPLIKIEWICMCSSIKKEDTSCPKASYPKKIGQTGYSDSCRLKKTIS